jgi:REP element-mobilizing transposase RayT
MVRGIEKRRIVDDRKDREAFVRRMGDAATSSGTAIYAWALMKNHAHVLLRSGAGGVARFMRRFLTGYAINYNLRHGRHGHVFQNRYKSIVCDEDAYFRELVRYIHLNPLRAGLVQSVTQLDRYQWCGHSALVGEAKREWQESRYVLSWFGEKEDEAIGAYREFVAAGVQQGRCPELVGGGLVRSLGGWSQVRSLRKKGGAVLADERILGTGEFVERVIAESDARIRRQVPLERRWEAARQHVVEVCEKEKVDPQQLRAGGRHGALSRCRAQIARHLVDELGLSFAEAAGELGVCTSAIWRAIHRAKEREVNEVKDVP